MIAGPREGSRIPEGTHKCDDQDRRHNLELLDLMPAFPRLKCVMEKKGFVGIFGKEFTRERVSECVASWLERFEKVEQVAPANEFTLEIKGVNEIIWDANLQFRVSNADLFAWVYITLGHATMETTGFVDGEISFCLQILLELPDTVEIVDEKNQRRLDELEKAGVI
jgi:hypothetical protein